jgi:hypothetical protein
MTRIEEIVKLIQIEARERESLAQDYVAALHSVLVEISLIICEMMAGIRKEERR